MSKFIKLIWDYRGPDSAKTSEHHVEHLREFIERNNLEKSFADFEKLSEGHFIAFIVVENEKMLFVRDSLKPQRGELFKSKI